MDSSVASAEYTRYLICKMMGWDFYTYENQPPFFLQQISIIINQEMIKSRRDSNQMASQAKRAGGLKRN